MPEHEQTKNRDLLPRQRMGLLLLRLLALAHLTGLAVAVYIHGLAYAGAAYDAVMGWHEALVVWAFSGFCGVAVAFALQYRRPEFVRYEYALFWNGETLEWMHWPRWMTYFARAVLVYAVFAFLFFFVGGESVVELDGQYFVYPENGGDKAPITDATYREIAVQKQRGVTALYLPWFLGMGAMALFARGYEREE